MNDFHGTSNDPSTGGTAEQLQRNMTAAGPYRQQYAVFTAPSWKQWTVPALAGFSALSLGIAAGGMGIAGGIILTTALCLERWTAIRRDRLAFHALSLLSGVGPDRVDSVVVSRAQLPSEG